MHKATTEEQMEVQGLLATSMRQVWGKTSKTFRQPPTTRSVLLQQAPTQKVDHTSNGSWFNRSIVSPLRLVMTNRHCHSHASSRCSIPVSKMQCRSDKITASPFRLVTALRDYQQINRESAPVGRNRLCDRSTVSPLRLVTAGTSHP